MLKSHLLQQYHHSFARVRIVLLLFLIALALLLTTTFSTNRAIDQLHNEWQEYGLKTQAKFELISQLRAAIGYSGFIHHFKNYVIRREQAYLISAQQTMATSQDLLQNYQQLALSQKEQLAIDDISQTIDDYQHNLNSINHSAVAQLSITELDQRVRVNDNAAAQALTRLSSILEHDYLHTKQQTSQLLAMAKRRLQLIKWLGIPALIIFCVYTSALVIHATRSRDNLAALFSVIPDGFLVAEPCGRIIQVNPKACEIFGFDEQTLLNKQLSELIGEQASDEPQPSCGCGVLHYGRHKNGDLLPLDVEFAALTTHKHSKTITVVRSRKEELELKQLSETDHLSGVHNRMGIDRVFHQEIERCQRYQHNLALILIDIDHFKAINDRLGHQAGDRIISAIAELLKQESRPSDSIGRWGGDEFCMICPETTSQEAMKLAKRLQQQLKSHIILHPMTNKPPTLSIGISELGPGDDQASMFTRADAALYRSKEKGRDQVYCD